MIILHKSSLLKATIFAISIISIAPTQGQAGLCKLVDEIAEVVSDHLNKMQSVATVEEIAKILNVGQEGDSTDPKKNQGVGTLYVHNIGYERVKFKANESLMSHNDQPDCRYKSIKKYVQSHGEKPHTPSNNKTINPRSRL